MKLHQTLAIALTLTATTALAQRGSPTGPIEGRIVQLIPQGEQTLVVVDKGAKAGVQTGSKGKIAGVPYTLTVTEVSAFRSKALLPAASSAVGSNRSVRIHRRPAAPAAPVPPAAPASPGPDVALRQGLELLASAKADEWIERYCHPDLCSNPNAVKAVERYNIPAAARTAPACLEPGKPLAITRVKGDPARDQEVRIYVQCGPKTMPRLYRMKKDAGVWKFAKL